MHWKSAATSPPSPAPNIIDKKTVVGLIHEVDVAVTGLGPQIHCKYLYDIHREKCIPSAFTLRTQTTGGTMREWIQQVIAVHATNGYHVRKIDKEAIAISVKQSTGPAFENHALNNIYDPVHNIAAGVGCAVNRDRSVGNMPDVLAVRAGLLNVPH